MAYYRVDFVNDRNAEEVKKRPHFQALTPLYPDERIQLRDRNTKLFNAHHGFSNTDWFRSTWFNSGAAKAGKIIIKKK